MESIAYVKPKIPSELKSFYSGQVDGAVLCTISTIGAGDSKIESIETATEVIKNKIAGDKFSLEIQDWYSEIDLNTFGEQIP